MDPAINAMVIRAFDRARAEAKAAEEAVMRGEKLGPLHGLPVAIKDNQATQGIKTTYGTMFYENNIPKADDDIVATIRNAGGIIIGKTNIPEMSIGANTVNRLFGATGNPFDVDRTCGGSSGGAAAAIATNMVPLATGSDHGGSLRIPACYCGVVGYRSTPGVVPAEKRTMTQTFYSVQGPIARTVEDAALLLSVIAQRRNRLDPMAFPLDAMELGKLAPIDVSKLRIAVSSDLGGVMVSDSTRRIFETRVARFSSYLSKVEWHDIDLREAPSVDWHLRSDIFVTHYHRDIDNYDEGFNPNIRRNYNEAIEMPMKAIAKARRTQMELYQRFQTIFDDFDLLICPGTSVSPFPWKDLYPREVDGKQVENYMAWLGLTASITVVGHPVVALPCGTDEHGLPFGIQVIGPNYGDRRLLSAANALEDLFSTDPTLARPTPNFSSLSNAESQCRTEGKTIY
jgi:Asp-tRNA(Asn)/Glu-tRNA(Gln) amidotransferase A subunit family amidase